MVDLDLPHLVDLPLGWRGKVNKEEEIINNREYQCIM